MGVFDPTYFPRKRFSADRANPPTDKKKATGPVLLIFGIHRTRINKELKTKLCNGKKRPTYHAE